MTGVDVGDLGGLGALALALFWIARTLRADARLTRRWEDVADELRGRVHLLEQAHARERARRLQLEDVMRQAGMQLPPWRATEDPTTTTTPAGHGRLIRFPWSRTT